ncbi:MAG TPA: hypothetical protein VFV34_11465 [Blastocatellia bacterium]|nr:hypothetical protein [Blastocatellia bacterium]
MTRVILSLLAAVLISPAALAQKEGSPTHTALTFYQALRQKHYIEGFSKSVYRDAVKGLSAAELHDLEPDFVSTFSEIPDKIEARGEQVTGDTATVLLKFGASDAIQNVTLVKIKGEWLVGDKESLELVKAQGTNFFFNARIEVNESEVVDSLVRMIGAEFVYQKRFEGRCGSLAELIDHGALSRDLADGQMSGYQFTFNVAGDQKSFNVTATPIGYGRTGRLSFYADANGIRAEDAKGKTATEKSPVYHKT